MALLTLPDLTTLIESTFGLYSAKVLSTPSPKDIFLTVNFEFTELIKDIEDKFGVTAAAPVAVAGGAAPAAESGASEEKSE